MSEVRMKAEPRTEFGKGAARRVRRSHRVPAVVYGHGQDPRHISLPGHELMLALKTPNVLLSLDLDGATELTLPKQVQRDPVKGFLEHVDLVLVRRGEKVTVDVPVAVVGEADSAALVNQEATTISVEAEATHIPTGFEVSVDGLGVGAHITAGEISLPSGVTLAGDPEHVVVALLAAPTAEQLEAELAEAEADLGAGAAGQAEAAEAAEGEEAAEGAEGAEGEGTPGEPSGDGDVVPDTGSGEGGPAEQS